MDEFQTQETVVEAPVDAGHEEVTETHETPETAAETSETVPNPGNEPQKNVGEAISREAERRAAKQAEEIRKQYEQQMESLRQQNSYLEKQAKIYGFQTVEEYQKAVDEHYRQLEIEEKARELGLDPDTYAQKFDPVFREVAEMREKLSSYEQREQQKQQEMQAQAAWSELYKDFPHLVESAKAWNEGKNPDWYTPQMQELIGMGYKPIHAYQLAHMDTIQRQKEQQVLAQVTGRDQKQVLPSTDSPNNIQFDPANMTSEQIDEISRRVRNGERITF